MIVYRSQVPPFPGSVGPRAADAAAMYQNPPRYVPGPVAHAVALPPRRRRIVPFVLPFLLFGVLFFGGSYAIAPAPAVEVLPGFAFVDTGGRDLLLVPYERNGTRGMYQSMTQDTFQVRLAAVDPGTGEVRWDTRLSGQSAWEAAVLAGGRRYAYVTTGSGLAVVDLADGAVVADGLGDAVVAAAYDRDGRRVLTMNTEGDVLAVPLDRATAAPVDEQTAAAWSVRLSAAPGSVQAIAQEAALTARERIALRDLPFGIPGRELVRNGGRWWLPVGGTAFRGGSLVVDGAAAVGAASGHVLVQHQRQGNDSGLALSMVTADNGMVTGSVDIEHAVTRAVTGPDGTAAVSTGPDLALARGDGRVVRVAVGVVDFFGAAS